jgi:hypothetical protein
MDVTMDNQQETNKIILCKELKIRKQEIKFRFISQNEAPSFSTLIQTVKDT